MTKETYDVCVIGSGPGGYVAALRAAELGLKAVCVEKDSTFGGTCLNVGCIPSKALLQSSEYYAMLKEEGDHLGIIAKELSFDFAKMQKRKKEIVDSLVTGIGGLFKRAKVASKAGTAKFVNPTTIAITSNEGVMELEAKHFILATGSQAAALPFLPFDETVVLSSTGALSLKEPPKKLVVIGAGVIGVELASVYKRLGSHVTIIEMLDRICSPMDPSIAKMLMQQLKKQGIEFHLGAKLLKGEKKDDRVELTALIDGKEQVLDADKVLVAVGRRPYTEGLGLSEIGVAVEKSGLVKVDSNFKSNVGQIYAIGDIIEGPMLAHRASIEGAAVAEIIAGRHPYVNYMTIPNVVYTHPEMASVGLSEQEAQEKGIKFKVGSSSFKANARARCMGYSEGVIKVLAESATGRIIGVHMLGPQVSELIAEGALAIESKSTLSDIAALCHAHPTLSETFHEAILSALHS